MGLGKLSLVSESYGPEAFQRGNAWGVGIKNCSGRSQRERGTAGTSSGEGIPALCPSGRIQGSAPGISSHLLTPCLQGRRSPPQSVPPVWPQLHWRFPVRAKAAAAFPV